MSDEESVLKEQLAFGLRDDFLRREMKRRIKEERSLTFTQLMQDAITWSEKEEAQSEGSLKTSVRARAAVHTTVATGDTNVRKVAGSNRKISCASGRIVQNSS